jgi:hypothetical protein
MNGHHVVLMIFVPGVRIVDHAGRRSPGSPAVDRWSAWAAAARIQTRHGPSNTAQWPFVKRSSSELDDVRGFSRQ